MENILALLRQLPPDFENAKAALDNGSLSSEELTAIYGHIIDDCFMEYSDFREEHKRDPYLEELHSTYLPDCIQMLLDYGLDPNSTYLDLAPIYSLLFVDAPNIAAETMRLLLKHGGNPNLMIGGNHLFCDVDFMVAYDCVDKEHFVQCLFVLAAFGGDNEAQRNPFSMKNGYEITRLKDFESISYFIEPLGGYKWRMHICDRDTGEEIAVYE